jgi:hypothetical protein
VAKFAPALPARRAVIVDHVESGLDPATGGLLLPVDALRVDRMLAMFISPNVGSRRRRSNSPYNCVV